MTPLRTNSLTAALSAFAVALALAGPGGLPGIFAPIHAAVQGMSMLAKRTLPAAGQIRLCNYIGCPESLVLNLAQPPMGAAVGPGVGGTIMASNPLTTMRMGGTK